MAKVMKIGGKLVKLYVIGRTAWLILGMGYKRMFEQYDVDMADWGAAAQLGIEVADDFTNEAKQGWSHAIKYFKYGYR